MMGKEKYFQRRVTRANGIQYWDR